MGAHLKDVHKENSLNFDNDSCAQESLTFPERQVHCKQSLIEGCVGK